MFCQRCGANLPQNATYCHNCGMALSAPINEPPTPPPMDEEAKRGLTFASLKQVFSSPLYLILVLVTAISAVLNVCQLAFFDKGVYSIDAFSETFPDLLYYDVIDYVRYAVAGINVLYLVSVVLMVILRFFVYNSAANPNNQTVSHKALGALKWGYSTKLLCDFLPVLMFIAGLFTPIARVGIMQGRFDFLSLLEMILGFCLSVVFTVFIWKTINKAKNVSLTGVPSSKASVFVIVMLFISAYFKVADFSFEEITIYGLNRIDWFGMTLKLFEGVNSLLLGLVILKYRKAMKVLENKK